MKNIFVHVEYENGKERKFCFGNDCAKNRADAKEFAADMNNHFGVVDAWWTKE